MTGQVPLEDRVDKTFFQTIAHATGFENIKDAGMGFLIGLLGTASLNYSPDSVQYLDDFGKATAFYAAVFSSSTLIKGVFDIAKGVSRILRFSETIGQTAVIYTAALAGDGIIRIGKRVLSRLT